MARTFICTQCRRDRATDTTVGPLPSVCDDCLGPEEAAKRRAHRERTRTDARRRSAQRATLSSRGYNPTVEAKKLILRTTSPRAAFAFAVRRLARAEGLEETREAIATMQALGDVWLDAMPPALTSKAA